MGFDASGNYYPDSWFNPQGDLLPISGIKSNYLPEFMRTPTRFNKTVKMNPGMENLNSSFYDNVQLDYKNAPGYSYDAEGNAIPNKAAQESMGVFDNLTETDKGYADFFKSDSVEKPGVFGDMTTGDWFTAAQQGANAIGSLYNIYQGNKMLGLYQDQFDFNKKLSKTNLFNQAQTVNAEMSDRQRMRNSMGAGLSTEDYMKKYGVRGKM